MKKRTTQPKTRRRSRKRKLSRFGLFVVVSLVDVVLLVINLLLLPAALRSPDTDKKSWIGVRSITIVGNTQYEEEAILGISGIKVGQSIFTVNSGKAVTDLKKNFNYIEDVSVDVNMKREVTIRITEIKEMGAVYANGYWIMVDKNGVGLSKEPINSERPLRRLYLKGAKTVSSEIGKPVLDERSLAIAHEICEAFELYELGDVSEIDMSNLSNIRANWKNQIEIAFGNDSNLSYEVAVAAATIPKVLARHGATATGRLNVSQYSDKTIESPVIIFTPSNLLDD